MIPLPLRVPLLGLTLAAAAGCAAPRSANVPPASATAASDSAGSRLPDSLLALMTLEEKLGQLTMAPADWSQTGPRAPGGGDQKVRQGRIGSFLNFWGAAATRRMQHVAVEESRLHIPLLFAYDVIHGWRTVFPVPLAEAASFDTAAVEGAARIAAVEASAYGVHWTFAPMVDIARDARWGRVVEGAGEDPFLGSAMAAARVRGFQGRDLTSPTAMMATVKHFAAYGAAEAGRDYSVADVSERSLWEVYLPPFEAAVRAGAGSIMAAFNEIGGTPAHASEWLLSDVLRARWGFRGLVVSDWTGVEELLRHGVAADRPEAAARALRAGVDIEMSSTTYFDLAPAVEAGGFPLTTVDSAVLRVLRAKQALGLFDDPYRGSDTVRERRVTLTAEHRAAARDLARKAIVLLKNDAPGAGPTLPLRKDLRSIAVIGPLADDARAALGSWAGAGKPEDVITLLEGIRRALPGTRVLHARGAPVDTVSTRGFAEAERMAREADAVVLVLGEREDMSAEAASRASVELPGSQEALARTVTRAARAADPAKPVVAVLMNGRPLAVPWLADSVPAIVEAWFLGVEHGPAVADVLFGDHNPSGRLPVTMPRVTGQVPIYHSQKPTGRPPSSERYTSKYIDVPWTPQWPFGHGLSYTSFAYSDLRLSADSIGAGDSVVMQVSVRNTGSRAGDEVVQLYLRDDAASVTRPGRALKGFARVALGPGEVREVRLKLRPEDLSLYDLTMRRVVEPGGFTVFVRGSSDGGLEGRFRVVGDTLVLAAAPPRMR
ncbi:MAG: glycoside hydrolase family 3 C-terminal domain-containing protein [Gemmatimonadales bacterium]|nr:glycoside hydrolase family 3 C-terminal domain-containing protein [Gemmatimonadales bacterium]